mmetsp:Transcript_125764/g.298540  ORF Transcript_125764/g.298540 Transcript_125764/m.298540 type:complete len:160 (-) Transcript_125764:68-547(-)
MACVQLCRGTWILDDSFEEKQAKLETIPECVQPKVCRSDGESESLVFTVICRAPRHELWPSTDAWTGCGGNPNGIARCNGAGNCSSNCENCGAHSHWRCCGSTDANSEFCVPGTRGRQAKRNNDLCYQLYDPLMPAPTYCVVPARAGKDDAGRTAMKGG